MPVHHRTCSLCDALCRLRVHTDGDRITRIEGDPDDPFSRGHLCPKAVGLQDIHEDPDRLRTPLRRTPQGFVPIGWDEALDEVARRLAAVRAAHGRDAVALYVGNPNAHHYANLLGLAVLIPVLDTRARFSAQSVDNLPHQVAAAEMIGHPLRTGVPDVDRTDLLVILGANPWVANGGGMSSGDVRARIRAVQERGGRVIVLDPRRTETAAIADAWHPLRPGTDALLLLAVLQVLFAEGRADQGAWRSWTDGVDALAAAAARFPPERVEDATGVPAAVIRDLARALADAPTAVIYGRLGVCTQRFGGLAAWLVVAVNAVTGNLDRPGGLMLCRPAVDLAGLTRALGLVRGLVPGAARNGLPSFADELPLSALADEIERPGAGQVRALITLAGNPVLSAPHGRRVEAALDRLDCHVAIDLYLSETARKADIVLPATGPLQRSHFPLALGSITVRSVASWSDPLFPPDGGRDDWDILTELARRLARAEGRYGWVLAATAARRIGPERILDLLLRAGPFGSWRRGARADRGAAASNAAGGRAVGSDGRADERRQRTEADFTSAGGPRADRGAAARDADGGRAEGRAVGSRPGTAADDPSTAGPLTLATLRARPHTTDLGALVPQLPGALSTPDRALRLAPAVMLADLPRLEATLAAPRLALVLIGRRDLRSNNSWMHNSPRLMRGKERCTLLIHPEDAARRGVTDGGRVCLTSRTGRLEVTATVTSDLMPGVVSLPHGWGHDRGAGLRVAAAHPGVSANDVTDDAWVDPLTGVAGLSGVPVEVAPAPDLP